MNRRKCVIIGGWFDVVVDILYNVNMNGLCVDNVCSFTCLSVCGVVAATKSFVGFSLSSVYEYFTKSCQARVSFVKIDSGTAHFA
jgi:hypothetical protein